MIIIPGKCVFLHFAHTAGMWAEKTLRELKVDFFRPPRINTPIQPASTIPEDYRDLPVWGFARDPVDWYMTFSARHAAYGNPYDGINFRFPNYPDVTPYALYARVYDARPFVVYKYEHGIHFPWSFHTGIPVETLRKFKTRVNAVNKDKLWEQVDRKIIDAIWEQDGAVARRFGYSRDYNGRI